MLVDRYVCTVGPLSYCIDGRGEEGVCTSCT